MIIRDLVEKVVDMDVETGATTLVMINVDGMPPLTIKDVRIEEGESFEGNTSSSPTIWIDAEEM